MTNWKRVNYLRQGETLNYDHQILLPEPLANWDTFDYWEKERTRHIQSMLKPDDILFDVGAESGWLSVVYAKFCNVFLIEPTREWWPNIYGIWQKNVNHPPIGTFSGLAGDGTTTNQRDFAGWPGDTAGDLLEHNKYEYLHEHTAGIQSITIDDLVERSGIVPTAITIDVEGGELTVLTGAVKTLKNNNLKVWVSIHPDLLSQYKYEPLDIHGFMLHLGYYGSNLANDHEEHWYYSKI